MQRKWMDPSKVFKPQPEQGTGCNFCFKAKNGYSVVKWKSCFLQAGFHMTAQKASLILPTFQHSPFSSAKSRKIPFLGKI